MVINHHNARLLAIGLPTDLNVGVSDLRLGIVGSHSIKTSVQLISTYHWDADDEVATFLLPRDKALQYSQNKYEIGLVDVIFWRVVSNCECPSNAQPPTTSLHMECGSVVMQKPPGSRRCRQMGQEPGDQPQCSCAAPALK